MRRWSYVCIADCRPCCAGRQGRVSRRKRRGMRVGQRVLFSIFAGTLASHHKRRAPADLKKNRPCAADGARTPTHSLTAPFLRCRAELCLGCYYTRRALVPSTLYSTVLSADWSATICSIAILCHVLPPSQRPRGVRRSRHLLFLCDFLVLVCVVGAISMQPSRSRSHATLTWMMPAAVHCAPRGSSPPLVVAAYCALTAAATTRHAAKKVSDRS